MNHDDFDLIASDSRIVALPIGRPELYKLYDDARRCYWTPDEIKFYDDAEEFPTMDETIKNAILYILGWFASADGRVVINLSSRFITEIPIYEVTRFYNFQNAIEDIHAETYAKNIMALIPDEATRVKIFNSYDTMPIIRRMNMYVESVTTSDDRLAVRLLKFACVEGIWFTGCFAFIDWVKERGLLPGTCQANELISRDEALHTDFGLMLINMIKKDRSLTTEEAHKYVTESVEIAYEFIKDMLPERKLAGMNQELMMIHIRSKADDILISIKHKTIWNVESPWKNRGLLNKTSFFERHVSDYSKVNTSSGADDVDYDV